MCVLRRNSNRLACLSHTNSIYWSLTNGWKSKWIENGVTTFLALKRLVAVACKVNLRNSLCTGEIHPGFETKGRHHRSPKQVSVAPQKTSVVENNFKKDASTCLCCICIKTTLNQINIIFFKSSIAVVLHLYVDQIAPNQHNFFLIFKIFFRKWKQPMQNESCSTVLKHKTQNCSISRLHGELSRY